MRRRALLATCVGCASGIAGCGGDLSSTDGSRHPFADAAVGVRIDDRSDTDHDVGTNAREALAYWNDNAEQYAGFDVEFDVVGSDPDLTIAYVDTPEPCRNVEGYSESVLGCAPVLGPRTGVPDDLTAYVVAANRPFGKVRITTKHEIGHVLGLYHDADPREIMSNRPEDRIPLYDVRIDIWEAAVGTQERSDDGIRLFEHGIDVWNGGRYGAAEAAFDAANEPFRSAIELVETASGRADEFDGHPSVETVDLGALRDHLERLLDRTTAAAGFTRRMADASAARDAGDTALANEALDDANEHIRAFNAVRTVQLRDVAVALGLVRGFDRDDPIVDVDGEELA